MDVNIEKYTNSIIKAERYRFKLNELLNFIDVWIGDCSEDWEDSKDWVVSFKVSAYDKVVGIREYIKKEIEHE